MRLPLKRQRQRQRQDGVNQSFAPFTMSSSFIQPWPQYDNITRPDTTDTKLIQNKLTKARKMGESFVRNKLLLIGLN